MKRQALIPHGVNLLAMLWFGIVSIHPAFAGNITASPDLDKGTDDITVPPNDDGTYTVVYTVTTGDDNVTATGTFSSAPRLQRRL
jgi:hypothetical protein